MEKETKPEKRGKLSQIGNYKCLNLRLGEGSFSKVELAKHLVLDKEVALKIIRVDKIKDPYVKKNLQREATIMTQLNHPNIITLYEVCAYQNFYCLVMEFWPGGSLCNFICQHEEGLGENLTRRLFKQILNGVEYMHSRNVVHRDIKLDNILINKEGDHVVIGDFGLSNFCYPGQLLETHCGSPEYAAPEIFLKSEKFSAEVDVWSCGVVLYVMLTCQLPFTTNDQEKDLKPLRSRIKVGLTVEHLQRLKDLNISESCRALLYQILVLGVEVKARPRLTQLQLSPWCSSVADCEVTASLSHQQQLQVAEMIQSRLNLKNWSPVSILTYVKSNKGLLGKTAGCFNILAQDLKLKLAPARPAAYREEMLALKPSQTPGTSSRISKKTTVVDQVREKSLKAPASPNLLQGAAQYFRKPGKPQEFGRQETIKSSTKKGSLRRTVVDTQNWDSLIGGARPQLKEREAPANDRRANFNFCQVVGERTPLARDENLKKRGRSSSVFGHQSCGVDKINSGRSRPNTNVESTPFKYLDNNINEDLWF